MRYPDNHIEVDCRLPFYLGRLEKTYGDEPLYVHLERNREDTARSWRRRYWQGIMRAFSRGIMKGGANFYHPLVLSREYVDMMTENIEVFLQNKPNTMHVQLENIAKDFAAFWDHIGAEGDREAAIETATTSHNTSENSRRSDSRRPVWRRMASVVKDEFLFRTGRGRYEHAGQE